MDLEAALDSSIKALKRDEVYFEATARTHGAELKTLDRLKKFADYRVLLPNKDKFDVALCSTFYQDLALIELMYTSESRGTRIDLPAPGLKAQAIAFMYNERFYILKATDFELKALRQQFKDGEETEAFDDTELLSGHVYRHKGYVFATLAVSDIRASFYKRWTVPVFSL